MKLNELTKEQRLTYVGLLTELQKDELVGQLYAPDSYFNPIQDVNDNWVISVEEIEQTMYDLLEYWRNRVKEYGNVFLQR